MQGRITFRSLPGVTQDGRDKVVMEIIDVADSTPTVVKFIGTSSSLASDLLETQCV